MRTGRLCGALHSSNSSTLAQLFGMNTRSKQTAWANDVMKQIRDGKVRYGVAFDGDIDNNILRRLNKINHEFHQWSNGKSELYIFMVNLGGSKVSVDKLQNTLNKELV